MKKQKKQSLLNAIIIILVLALVLMIGSIVYEEITNINKQPIQETNTPVTNEEMQKENEEADDEKQEEPEIVDGDETVDIENETIKENDEENSEDQLQQDDKQEEQYVGKEENEAEKKPEVSIDQKVIDLVKKEWKQDNSVIFSIEKKNGNKYRVAVRDSSTTVLAWYEVDTETWVVSEY